MSVGVGASIHRSTAEAAYTRAVARGPRPEIIEVRSKDGTRIHTEAYGPVDAPVIVLSHGILCRLAFWRNQIFDLAGDHRVIAFDHRGHGRSQAAPARAYTFDHLADDLHAVLCTAVPDGRPAVVAGHSMGGIAVMSWAERYPQDIDSRIAAVALVNTTPGEILDHLRFLRGPERLIPLRRRTAQTVAPLARMPLPKHLPLRRQLLTRVAVGPGADPAVTAEVDRMLAGTSTRGRGGYGNLLVNMVHTVDPSKITAPTMVIAGRYDRISPPSRSEWIAERLPNLLELRTFDSGHCGPLERPAEVSASLRELADTYCGTTTPKAAGQ
ncbi:alpha/beta hydrolase [Rhodococcus sp. Z13]|uniref:Alpha/beta hydrolase n=1 Tax=Rhodococcus sacchari TaxID=2962047 RepID=A0ACD4DF87_9NOCA|nr:alpha/beta hydrolase [Rhodococcus sp. Z13]UYP18343.1 alpha/beta hydrolase [Rhodococcus sp. Z13]